MKKQQQQKLSIFLKEKRAKAGLTQSEVATKLGYSSPQFVSNWERGLAKPPVFILRDLTKLYKVKAEEMFSLLLAEVKEDLYRDFYSPSRRRRA